MFICGITDIRVSQRDIMGSLLREADDSQRKTGKAKQTDNDEMSGGGVHPRGQLGGGYYGHLNLGGHYVIIIYYYYTSKNPVCEPCTPLQSTTGYCWNTGA